MARRRSNHPRSRVWPWISFILFACIATLLGYSIINKQHPGSVLQSLLSGDIDSDDISRLNKDELITLLEQKDGEVKQLTEALNTCLKDDGYQKGIINTTSNTLNMRSEASIESDIIIRIPRGSKVSILYYDDQQLVLDGVVGRWCRIKYADQEGWVWGNYIEKI